MISKLNSQNIFLIDGIGAVITTVLIAFLLGSFTSFFGVPTNIVYILAGSALGLVVYSFSCHFLLKASRLKNFQLALRIIAILNISYCLITTWLVFTLNSITIWGVLYFVGEILLVLMMGMTELRLARRYS